MTKSYYSTVFEQSADDVWSTIRAFDNYEWAGTVSETHMEEDKAGDAVGGIRRILSNGQLIRQRLRAHSDVDRTYTYEFCGPCPFPLENYQATLRVTPVTDGNRAFVEWWATFDCAKDERDHWKAHFENEGFAKWLGSLRAQLG